jgi:fatty acid desaturase
MGQRHNAQEAAQRGSAGARAGKIEWPTVWLAAACYGIWAACGVWLWPMMPILSLIIMGFMAALHSSLVHECLHGHPTRNAGLNELLVWLPLGLVWPYRRFKALHMRHHADERLTDPFDDPESYYKTLWTHETMPRWFRAILRVNNALAGRIVLNPLLGSAGLMLTDAKAIVAGDRGVLDAWLRHLAGAAVVMAIAAYGFGMPLWLYILVPCWMGQSIIAIRTYAEHQWHESPEGRTIIVERSPLSLLFLNNNLHLVHHKLPTAPWYKLPKLFAERRAEWVAMNKGYVFANYRALARAYLFKAKEPVVHPALRREP